MLLENGENDMLKILYNLNMNWTCKAWCTTCRWNKPLHENMQGRL